MKEIDIRNIIEITDARILYRDEQGNAASFELELCADNFDRENHLARLSDAVRCVGDRCWTRFNRERVVYYELYTAGEHTRLYLELKTNFGKRLIEKVFDWNFYTKEYSLFHSVQKRLAAHGWTTYDRT